MTLSQAFKERFAEAAATEKLVDATYEFVHTPVGRLLVIETHRGVCAIGFENDPAHELLARVSAGVGPRVVRSSKSTAVVRNALLAYLEGERPDLALPVDNSLMRSDFQRSVLRAALGVRPGSVITYGELARILGHPGAARAVGTALARNPVPLILPCHRVVPSAGGVGSYRGGPDLKRSLLRLEGALP